MELIKRNRYLYLHLITVWSAALAITAVYHVSGWLDWREAENNRPALKSWTRHRRMPHTFYLCQTANDECACSFCWRPASDHSLMWNTVSCRCSYVQSWGNVEEKRLTSWNCLSDTRETLRLSRRRSLLLHSTWHEKLINQGRGNMRFDARVNTPDATTQQYLNVHYCAGGTKISLNQNRSHRFLFSQLMSSYGPSITDHECDKNSNKSSFTAKHQS